MNKLLELIKAGWGTLYLAPFLEEGMFKAIIQATLYKEEWPDGWVLVPLSNGALLYQQNQYGLYRFVCYDPNAPISSYRSGCYDNPIHIVNDLNLVQIIINGTIRYMDLDEAHKIADIMGVVVRSNGTHHFAMEGGHLANSTTLTL